MIKTRFIFVRHGEADGNVQRLFHGWHNSNLTKNGHMQARLTAAYLIPKPIDVLYASDLRRTLDTAGYIARQKGLKVHPEPGLREISGGAWENLTWTELEQRYPEEYQAFHCRPQEAALPGGENMPEVQRRVSRALGEIQTRHEGKNICIVTHGTVLRCMLCLWRGWPAERMQELPWFDNASVTELEVTEQGIKIITEGENRQLGAYGTLHKQTWWKK